LVVRPTQELESLDFRITEKIPVNSSAKAVPREQRTPTLAVVGVEAAATVLEERSLVAVVVVAMEVLEVSTTASPEAREPTRRVQAGLVVVVAAAAEIAALQPEP
jgi:hypothetical protein